MTSVIRNGGVRKNTTAAGKSLDAAENLLRVVKYLTGKNGMHPMDIVDNETLFHAVYKTGDLAGIKYLASLIPEHDCEACSVSPRPNVFGENVHICDACCAWKCVTCLTQLKQTSIEIGNTNFAVCSDCAKMKNTIEDRITSVWATKTGLRAYRDRLESGKEIKNVLIHALLSVYDAFAPLEELHGQSMYTMAKKHIRHDIQSMIRSYYV